jgi:hypothetical protein
MPQVPVVGLIVTKIFARIPRKTRFLKKAGFPDRSGKNFSHITRLFWRSSARYQLHLTATRSQKKTKLLALAITPQAWDNGLEPKKRGGGSFPE